MTYLLIAIVVIAALAAFIASRPATFAFSRSITIKAPSGAVFPYINNLHKWEAWSPWARLDPNAKNSFEGPDEGTGAMMRWDGNNKVGAGSMTITGSTPPSSVLLRLDFLKPMKGTSNIEFTFTPEGSGTRVTWSMSGENNFIAKAMSLVMSCEKMVGGQYEQGLQNLKKAVEGAS